MIEVILIQKTEQRRDEETSGSRDYDSTGPSHQTYRMEHCRISGKRKRWPSDANAACIRLDQTDSRDSELVTDMSRCHNDSSDIGGRFSTQMLQSGSGPGSIKLTREPRPNTVSHFTGFSTFIVMLRLGFSQLRFSRGKQFNPQHNQGSLL